jgi:hypothetical protein
VFVLAIVVETLTPGVLAMDTPPHHTASGFRNLEPYDRPGPLVTVPFFLRRAMGALFPRAGAPQLAPNDGSWLRGNALHSLPSVT